MTGLELISAVRSADGDRKRVDTRARSEFFHFVGRSEHSVVRFDLYVVLHARKLAKLRFHDHAVIVRVFHDLFRKSDIFFPRFRGRVDHDRSKSAVDRGFADFKISAVIEVHGDGNIVGFHGGFDKMSEIDGVGVFSRAGGHLQNHGRFAFVRRLDDRLDHFHVVHVKRAYGVTAFISVLKHFGRSD